MAVLDMSIALYQFGAIHGRSPSPMEMQQLRDMTVAIAQHESYEQMWINNMEEIHGSGVHTT